MHAPAQKVHAAEPQRAGATRTPAAGSVPSELQVALDGRNKGRVQPKLRVGAPNDPHEDEADRVADEVMRMPAAVPSAAPPIPDTGVVRRAPAEGASETKTEEDDELVRRQATLQAPASGQSNTAGHSTPDAAPAVSPSVERQLSSAHEAMPLPVSTRAYFESRFGCDFSRVRVHTGSRAAESADSIDALAYTFGDQIVFNAGQFAPDTSDGRRLLAHELTHVVQQSPRVSRKENASAPTAGAPEPIPAEPIIAHGDGTSSARVVRRKPFYFAPPDKPKGSFIHEKVLPLFLKDNDDLFIEAPIPGATRKDQDKGAKGRADFYHAKPTSGASRTIGINFSGEDPSPLAASKVQWSGGDYSHAKQSAPRGFKKSPKVRNLVAAPTNISIGELKPAFSPEGLFGPDQIASYHGGIRETADSVNAYVTANPAEADSKKAWRPTLKTLGSLTIPPGVTYPSGSQFPVVPLALFENSGTRSGLGLGAKRVLEDTSLKGRLFVYADRIGGVWSYEWIPTNIPASTGSRLVNSVLNRLNNDVIPVISSKRKPSAATTAAGSVGSLQPVVRRKDKFNRKVWEQQKYDPWTKEAKNFLEDKKEVGKASVASALLDVEERSQKNLGIPNAVKDQGKGLDKIKHWQRFGGLYGWLKEKFGFVGDKLQKFADWVKKKVKNLTRSLGGSKFGSWVLATARVIFKIFKLVGAWAVRTALDKLLGSFQQGVSNNIKKLVEMATPEGVTSKIEEFDALKERYQQILDEKQDELIKRFFGDSLQLFEKISEFEAIAEKASTVAAIVQWGVRLLACASPPAIGCLWNLAIEALQLAFAMVMQTCWFTKKVAGPVLSEVELVKSFPTKVASRLATLANEHIPVPAGFAPLFADIETNLSNFEVDCAEAGDNGPPLTPERQAILDLRLKIGEEKFNALLEMMSKRAAGPWVLVTAERLRELETALETVSTETLKKLADEPSTGAPQALEAFLKDISKYTKREKETAKKFFESRQAAQAAKEAAAKGAGKSDSQGESASNVEVVDGSKHVIKGPRGGKTLPNMFAFVLDGSLEDERSQVKSVTVYIVVDKKVRYQVQNVTVKSVTKQQAPSPEYTLVIYQLQQGLEFDIDGQQAQWDQAVWVGKTASSGKP